jgi:uncharacterized membrane protein
MALWIVMAVAIVAWPVGLGAALIDRTTPPVSLGSSLVYLAASRVCHQRSDRSFHTAGQQWPVCARCAGLYLGGSVGALLGVRRLRTRRSARSTLAVALGVAAVPTLLSWSVEALVGVPVSGSMRALAAVPLGLGVALTVLSLLRPPRSAIG